jgi:hypothetical protein
MVNSTVRSLAISGTRQANRGYAWVVMNPLSPCGLDIECPLTANVDGWMHGSMHGGGIWTVVGVLVVVLLVVVIIN